MTSAKVRFAPIADPPAEELAAARAQYLAGTVSVAQLARLFGMSEATLKRRIARRWLWERTSGARSAASKKASGLRKRRGDVRGKVRASLRRQLGRLERQLDTLAEDADVERTARILASLVRTLADLARLDGTRPAGSKGPDDDQHTDAAPLDLAGLRADLARRLGGEGGNRTDDADTEAP